VISTPMLEPVRSLSATLLESLPSRIRIAAAPQSVPGHRAVRAAWFRTIMFWLDRNRCTAQPELPLRSLSATNEAVASTSPMPFWAPCAMTPVTLAPTVPCNRMPLPYWPKTSGRAGSSRSAVSVAWAVDRKACRRLPETSMPLSRWVRPPSSRMPYRYPRTMPPSTVTPSTPRLAMPMPTYRAGTESPLSSVTPERSIRVPEAAAIRTPCSVGSAIR
jgi:hypothetical protein